MASFSSGANPNVVKTALDDVFNQEHNITKHPQYADATTSAIFHQDTAENSAVIWEQFKGAGLWQTKLEEQDVPEGTPNIGGQKTFTVTEYAQRIEIPKVFFDDNMHKAFAFALCI